MPKVNIGCYISQLTYIFRVLTNINTTIDDLGDSSLSMACVSDSAECGL